MDIEKQIKENKLIRRLVLGWAVSMITVFVAWTWIDPPDIPAGTVRALLGIIAILATVITFYQWSRNKDDEAKRIKEIGYDPHENSRGAAVLLLIACGALWAVNGRIMDANATLKAEKSIMAATLSEQEERMKNLIHERERIEKVMSERLAAERAIRARNERELRERNTQLARLRKEYESIKDFLSIPVPPDFVDRWMRRADDSQDKD